MENILESLETNQEEIEYLQERFKEMSVKERYILEGAVGLNEINNASDLMNLTEQ